MTMTSSDGQQTPPVHASLSDGEADHAAPKDNNAKTAVNIRDRKALIWVKVNLAIQTRCDSWR
ncbi:MAG: hypothetical protein EBV34_01880 [Betaproteobacteria bacterium]|nr:hypothetical protein [Betaproteobacteria bacterium]